MGLRWARDQLHGEENLFTYAENLGGFGVAICRQRS